ncbi:hypothetical protein [Nocardioides pocheonensis]|uniref:TIGR04086 family membrane protein n=1 Tax=Nocardioides pocheonensis TaxID=661485 RepID=A0A3N0GXS6_9ACTN|nr:hypothetical protein [Nocardioides pocheonensis]RNM16930.1 hypothetical protein EFL26_02225 [Nocardioides pocheonensis]
MTQAPLLTRPVPLAVAAVGLGAVLGALCARVVLVGSGLSLVPWAVAGLASGACCRSRTMAAAVGALYGFALAFTFMTVGYDGAAPLHTRLLPFCLFGLVGAVCGSVLALAGRQVAGKLASR